MSRAALSLLGLMFTACAPSVRMEVLQPADIYVPQNIQQVAVVDRSRASSAGEAVLGALEAMVTGEDIGADRAGRAEAISSVTQLLASSPRFEVVQVSVDPDSGLFADTLDWRAARRLCPPATCQGIVALEALDSDSETYGQRSREVKTTEDGQEKVVTVYEVSRDTWVVTAWRLYDVENRRIIDDLRDFDARSTWTEEARTPAAAEDKLPPQSDAVITVSRQAGESYARRIAPTYIWVSRSFYGRRHDSLSAARPMVKAGNWSGAVALWEPLLSDADPKVRGKALYNMALHAEVNGDLQTAASLLSEAVSALPKGRVYSYQGTINRRIADQEALQQQLPGE